MKPNNAETGIETLRPCPFCGGRATSRACCENREHWYISCNKCHFEMRSIARGLPDTAERWNTRPTPLPDASLVEKRVREQIANDLLKIGRGEAGTCYADYSKAVDEYITKLTRDTSEGENEWSEPGI